MSRCGAVVLGLALVVLFGGRVSAETFDLHIFAYCDPTEGAGLCGFSSLDALQARVEASTQEMNLQWMPTGISFRPKLTLDTTTQKYIDITGCDHDHPRNPATCPDLTTACTTDDDCVNGPCSPVKTCFDLTTVCGTDADCPGEKCDVLNVQRQRDWRLNVAAADPTEVRSTLSQFGSWACSPLPGDGPNERYYGMYNLIGSTRWTGKLWAHEAGHYFCLPHTFTAQDFAETMPDEPDHDGDAVSQVLDTPPDPGRELAEDVATPRCLDGSACQNDDDCGMFNGPCNRKVFKRGHEYCNELVDEGAADDGSPHPDICGSLCLRCNQDTCDSGGDFLTLGYDPHEHNAMSYYQKECIGPFLKNGVFTFAFSFDQVARIQECVATAPSRADLVDVCAERGGDFDHDGICDADDNCPARMNTNQANRDGDPFGDVCDLCPDTKSFFQQDEDGDGIGDLCDSDSDGDGCDESLNGRDEPIDQHPGQGSVQVGLRLFEGCSLDTQAIYQWEGQDQPDELEDTVINCQDLDDDGDGVCDEGGPYPPDESKGIPNGCVRGPGGVDPCPIHEGTSPLLCQEPGDPTECPPDWLVCSGGDCFQFIVKILDVSNPDPTTVAVFERFQIFNNTLYFSALPGSTASQSAKVMAGPVGTNTTVAADAAGHQEEYPGPNDFRPPASLMAGIFRALSPEDLVAVIVDRYQPSEVGFGPIQRGRFVAVTPLMSGPNKFDVRTVYTTGIQPGDVMPDMDMDGRPDLFDNCIQRANPMQTDIDGDGFGNACDADLDGDNLVTAADLSAILACDGAELGLDRPFGEPAMIGDGPLVPPPFDEQAADLADRCEAADLNGDDVVDQSDWMIGEAMQGQPPGPSAFNDLFPIAVAGRDRVLQCGSTFEIDGAGSFDPEGKPVSCSWNSPTCSITDPFECVTTANCGLGGEHTITLTVHDGVHNSSPDEFDVLVQDCGVPGEAVPLTLDKHSTDSSLLVLSWTPTCSPGAADYAIYRGDIGDWYSHSPLACFDDFDFTSSVSAGEGDSYWLIVPHNWVIEGSYGRNSVGVERPNGGESACFAGQLITECPTGK